MSTSNLQVIIEAVDKASEPIKNVGVSFENMEKKLMGASIAIAGAGAGIEALARKNAPLLEKNRQLAASLGMTEKEVNGLARELSNVTFPLESVVGLLEQGRQQGLKSQEQLKDFANFWDMVGDATGENAVQLAEASVALRALGIEADDVQQAQAAFGFITRETTGDVGDFLTFIERTGPQLRDLGLGVDETASLMAALEQELGMTARVARQEFRKAVNESDGDLQLMLETLGLTEEQFQKYNDQVKASSDVIEENAEIHAKSYTAMQRAQAFLADLSFEYSGAIEQLSQFSMIMIALPAVLKGVMAVKAAFFALSTAGFGAMALAAAPFLIAGAVIAGLIAGAYLLYKNWDTIIEGIKGLWEGLKAFFTPLIEGLVKQFERLVAVVRRVLDGIQAVRDGASAVGGAISSGVRRIVGVNDAIISPKGDIITTHPDDYLIATKNPHSLGGGQTVINITGNTFMTDDEVAERVGDLIFRKLTLSTKYAN